MEEEKNGSINQSKRKVKRKTRTEYVKIKMQERKQFDENAGEQTV